MTFLHSLYVLSGGLFFCKRIYEPLSMNKQLFLLVFSIFVSMLISPDWTLFIFTVCVKSVPLYPFKLAYVVLHMGVKEFFETRFENWQNRPFESVAINRVV